MMENRSFDHMLGHLSLSGRMPDVDGLHAPLDQARYANPHEGRVYHPFAMRDARLDSDVPHNREHVPTQIAYSAAEDRYLMNGFARGYFEYRPDDDTDQPPSLGILPAEDVPVSTFFAERFAVCDRWFSSLPTGTPPNKLLSLAGRSRVEDVALRVLPSDNLVLDWLSRRGVRWRVYHDGLPFFSLFGRMDVMFDRDLFRPFEALADDVLQEPDATFPQVIFIEPAYEAGPLLGGRPRNDDHAPTPVSFGQFLQRRLYRALTANAARWRSTMLIITYDEHGGFYDHVAPLEIGYAPPDGEYPPFDTTGLRVPGLVVSPLVSPGRVYHGNLDHTSFLQLVAERFAPGEGGYSHEVNVRAARGIRSLSEVLDLDDPRQDIPDPPAFAAPPFDPGLARLLPASPVELLFDLAARKLVDDSPPEARNAMPELWAWHAAAGPDPAPAGRRGLELRGFGELMREHAGTMLADLPLDLMRAELRAPFAFSRASAERVTVSARAGASAEVACFNDAGDEDPDGLLVASPGNGLESLLPPQVVLDDDSAWLKYTLTGELGAGGHVDVGALGFDVDADTELRLTDYRRHARDEIAVAAVLADLSRPRVAISLDHVERLRPDDCLAMQFVGTVTAAVEVAWADVFATQFGALGALLGSDAAVPVKVSAGLTVAAEVSLQDDFVLAFSRLDREQVRVAVHKARRRRAGVAVEAAISVELADPQQVEAAVRALVASTVGAPYAELRALLASASGALDAPALRLLRLLLDALGIDTDIPDRIDELRDLLREVEERLDALEVELARTIATLARQKITAGFRYEYARISSRATLLQATLDGAALRRHHADLIRGHIDGVLAALRAGDPGLRLESWLRRERLDTSRSWGFTLGIGPWSVHGRDRDQVSRIVDENELGARRIAYAGLRAYAGNWFGEAFSWTLDFRADMRRFAAAPALSDFELGLALTWQRSERLSEKAISKLLDAAAVWGICTPADYHGLAERLREKLDLEAEITVQMRLDDATLRALLPTLGNATVADFAAAYATAMPWMAEYPGRRDVDLRQALYEPLWDDFFDDPDQRPDRLAERAERYFLRRPMPHKELRVVEINHDTRPWAAFAGLIRLNDKMVTDLTRFNDGMAKLAGAVADDRAADGMLDEVFDDIKDLGKQSLNLRALGARLAAVAADAGVADGIERSVSLAAGGDVWVIAPRRA